MKYTLNEIKLPLDYSPDHLTAAVIQHSGLSPDQFRETRVIRRSLDARYTPCYIVKILFNCNPGIVPENSKLIKPYIEPAKPFITKSKAAQLNEKPLIIGAGPAGLMAALILAEHGLQPVVFDQGSNAAARSRQISTYFKNGVLDEKSNILFGEGGAGLFSDGKLTSRHKDRETMHYFFQTLVNCGAPPDILIDAEPHLGSDLLLKIIPRLRELIEGKGGEFRYDTTVTGISTRNRALTGIRIGDEVLNTEYCILATGHSARDVYYFLADADAALEPKPFALGVRIEIPQEIINRAQYGRYHDLPQLGSASFRITRKSDSLHRACYTFCMCPGGEVMPCASSPGELTANGMSWSKRSGILGNAAFLVPVEISDFDCATGDYPMLGGCKFQQQVEAAAFTAGGSDYSLPASRLTDFLNRQGSASISTTTSCRRLQPGDVYSILPPFIRETLSHAVPRMLSRFGKLDFDEITVYGAETRSSSPVRITRAGDSLMSVTVKGLFPCGEGSGYAGGIVSSAIDGIRAAQSLLKQTAQS